MDPVPIDNRNNSCEEILATASKLATIFKNAAGIYSDLAPTFTAFHESCMTFAEAVRAIQLWLTDGAEKQLLEPAPWYQLTRSLGRAEKAINVLQDEVQTVLRSRYESRSRSRVVPEWNLEGLQNYGEDVQHETQTLQQILQYMKLLSISDTSSNSTIRAEDQHAVEGLGSRRASLPVIAGGSQADTVNTLDKPAPPYRLVDVRSNETHTQWYVEQPVDDATPVVPLPLNNPAGGNTVRELEIPPSALHPDVTEHGKEPLACPLCGQLREEQLMFEHVKQDHPDEAQLYYYLTIGKQRRQLLIYGTLSKGPNHLQYQVDLRDINFDHRWPWDTGICEFLVHFPEDDCLYLSGKDERLIGKLIASTDMLFSLLKTIRPHFDWGHDSDVEHIFVKIDMLWKLSISIWASGWVHDLAKYPGVLQLRDSIPVRLLELAYDLQGVTIPGDDYIDTIENHLSTRQEAATFANNVRANHLNELNELIQRIVSLELLLHTCPILQDLYKP